MERDGDSDGAGGGAEGRELGEHRLVEVFAEDGALTARLHVEWQYSSGYRRRGLEGVEYDGRELDPAEDGVVRFLDVDVEIADDGVLRVSEPANRATA